jgi:hypothetical protein
MINLCRSFHGESDVSFRLKTGTVDSSYRWRSMVFAVLRIRKSSSRAHRPHYSGSDDRFPRGLSGTFYGCDLELHQFAAATNFGFSESPATPESSYCCPIGTPRRYRRHRGVRHHSDPKRWGIQESARLSTVLSSIRAVLAVISILFYAGRHSTKHCGRSFLEGPFPSLL